MKKTLIIFALAATTLAISTQNISAKPKTLVANKASVATTPEQNQTYEEDLRQIQQNIQQNIQQQEMEHKHHMDELETKHRHELETNKASDEAYAKRHVYASEIELIGEIGKWLMIIIIPIIAIWVYLRNSKEKQREREALIDLVRSGTPITPEIVNLLGHKPENPNDVVTVGINKKVQISRNDFIYCITRISLACISLFIGFIIGANTTEAIFILGIILAVIFIFQACIRYTTAIMTNKNAKDNNNAQ